MLQLKSLWWCSLSLECSVGFTSGALVVHGFYKWKLYHQSKHHLPPSSPPPPAPLYEDIEISTVKCEVNENVIYNGITNSYSWLKDHLTCDTHIQLAYHYCYYCMHSSIIASYNFDYKLYYTGIYSFVSKYININSYQLVVHTM